MTSLLVRAGASLAVAGALHSTINARLLRRPRPGAAPAPPVTVLVPARNESSRLGPCLRSVVGQPGVAEVVVLDDGSSDDTVNVAAAAGARVVTGRPLPAGWLGKAWACEQLTAETDADVLVFVDADVRLEPGAVRAALGLFEHAGLDVICPFPRQLAGSTLERLVQPLLTWSWMTTLPLGLAERSRRPSLTAACGQFVVLRRSALERVGGFAAVRGAVLDDLALVRAVKAAGGRGGVVDGSRLAVCRMYEGAADVRAGYAKSLWTAFGSPARAGAVLAVLGLAYVVPPAAMLVGSRAGAVGYAAAVASRVVASRSCGDRRWPDCLTHPLSVLALAGLTADSYRQHRRGTLTWRGRPVAAARSTPGRPIPRRRSAPARHRSTGPTPHTPAPRRS